jgi:hypothetical protein
VDPLELLDQLGHVEPADQAVMERALAHLADAIRQDTGHLAPSTRAIRRRRFVAAIAAAAGVAAAATAIAITGLDHGNVGRPQPVSQSRSRSAKAVSTGAAPQRSTIAAVLTAFSASRDDILMVTRAVHGEGPCCRANIWISPAGAAPGTIVHSRVSSFTLSGQRLADIAITYTAPATKPATGPQACEGLFGRPRMVYPPIPGVPGTATFVDYPSRLFGHGRVRVQPATVPNPAELRNCLKDGQWQVVGPTVRAGTNEIELGSPSPDGSARLWVSAATFLPVELVTTAQVPGSSPTVVTFGFRFLPPASANQALFTVPIPAGFTKTPI